MLSQRRGEEDPIFEETEIKEFINEHQRLVSLEARKEISHEFGIS